MDSPRPNNLTREQIDSIIEAMTSRDLFSAMPAGETNVKGAEIAGEAFEHAADRQGFGPGALDRVSVKDGIYLAAALGELFSDGPKGDALEALPRFPDTGDLDPS